MNYSPYLQALQKIPGSTSFEKHQALYAIARRRIQEQNNMRIEVYPSEEIPEPLVPRVKLEIGLILKQPKDVIDGLKSNNQAIFFRAVNVKRFFRQVGTEGYPNDQDFKNSIFPYISLHNRKKIIKTLATRLTDPVIVESFFEVITERYGFDQARPLLKKCGHKLIRNCFNKYEVRLTVREMKYIYSKYPSLLFEYLDLQSNNDSMYESNLYYILETKANLRQFLPILLKYHSTYFCKLIQKYDNLIILLKSYKTFLFLKQERLALFNNPHLYLPILSLKKVTSLLPRNQLKILVRKFFPENPRDFKFMDVYILLDFMKPSEKFPFILETFRDNYDHELTDFHHCVISAIEYFPVEERHRQVARLMHHDHNRIDQSEIDEEKLWRCYLPITESLSWIIKDIVSCQSYSQKAPLFQQLIFLCGMNEDFLAMLDVLWFILIHYRQMDEWIMIKIFDQITKGFDIQPYIKLYWQDLYEFISKVNLRVGMYDSIENIRNIVGWAIQKDLERDRDITEKIIILTEVNEMNSVKPIWNICKNNAAFEEKCLDKFIKAIFSVYFIHRKTNTEEWKEAIVSFVSAMYDFKHRHAKESDIFELLSNRNYMRKLQNNIERLLQNYFDRTDEFDCRELITLLEENNSVILQRFPNQEDLHNIPRAIITLRQDINPISNKWQMYYNLCKRNIAKKSSKIFLERIKWFEELPKLFISECVKEIKISLDKTTIKMFTIFLEDSASKDIFKTFFHSELAIMDHPIALGVAEGIKYMNVPLLMVDIVTLYKSNFMPIIAEYFTALERRVPVNVLVDFLKLLRPKSNSVIKHIVRIYENTASSNDFQSLLLRINSNNYKKTRKYIFKNIYHGFITRPSNSTWRMMQLFLNNLNSNDDADKFDIITCYRKIDVRYIGYYIENILGNFVRIEALPNLCRSLKSLIHDFIKYYIMPADDNLLNYRLQIFSQIFEEMLTYYLVGADNINEVSTFLFVNKFLHEFKNYLAFKMPFSERKKILIKSILESFLKILTSFHDIEFYCYLQLTNLFDAQTSPRQFADKIDTMLLIIINVFPASVLGEFSNYLYDVVKFFYSDKSSQLEIVERLKEHGKENNTLVASLLLSKITAAD